MPQHVGTMPTYALHTILLSWQTKSILIIIKTPSKMQYCDALCRNMPPFLRASVLPLTGTEMANKGKMRQSVDVKSSKVVIVLLPFILPPNSHQSARIPYLPVSSVDRKCHSVAIHGELLPEHLHSSGKTVPVGEGILH